MQSIYFKKKRGQKFKFVRFKRVLNEQQIKQIKKSNQICIQKWVMTDRSVEILWCNNLYKVFSYGITLVN